jgi:hypothetical protein
VLLKSGLNRRCFGPGRSYLFPCFKRQPVARLLLIYPHRLFWLILLLQYERFITVLLSPPPCNFRSCAANLSGYIPSESRRIKVTAHAIPRFPLLHSHVSPAHASCVITNVWSPNSRSEILDTHYSLRPPSIAARRQQNDMLTTFLPILYLCYS